jgi:hypothetical protein
VASALVLAGPSAVFTPFRMVAAIALGPGALDASYSLVVAIAAGAVLHLVLAMMFALAFAAMIPVSFETRTEVELGMAYGFLLWVFNFHLIGPALGWVWFAQQTDPISQIAAHAIGYGAALGWFRHHAWMVDEAQLDADVHAFHALN